MCAFETGPLLQKRLISAISVWFQIWMRNIRLVSSPQCTKLDVWHVQVLIWPCDNRLPYLLHQLAEPSDELLIIRDANEQRHLLLA